MTVIRLPILDEAKRRPIARAANAGWFALALLAFGVTRRKKFDQIFVSTHPPLVMAAVARLIKSLRGSGYVYHCMDLYPEIAVDSGILRSERITLPLFKAIDKQNCKRADKVVVLSSDMKKTIAARDESVDNVEIINNFIIEQAVPNELVDPPHRRREDRLQVVYAGNLGRFQQLDSLVRAMGLLDEDVAIKLSFIGKGVVQEELERLAGPMLNDQISFEPYVPVAQLMSVLSDSCLLYTSPSPRDRTRSRMPSSA